jgi:uncharacterized protein YjbI with pentapeptide repeats
MEEWRRYDRRGIALLTHDSAGERVEWLPFDREGSEADDWANWQAFEEATGLKGVGSSTSRVAWLGFAADEEGSVRAENHEWLGDGSSSSGGSYWKKCATETCFAEASHPDGHCYVHTSDEHRQAYLAGVRAGETLSGLRGTYLTAEMVRQILSAVPDGVSNTVAHAVKVFSGVDLSWCTIEEFDVQHARFDGVASFNATVFLEKAWFGGSVFAAGCDFRWCDVRGSSSFNDLRVSHEALFESARFGGGTTFMRSSFAEMATFARTRSSTVMFNQCRFAKEANFDRAILQGPHNRFDACSFEGRVIFRDALFRGETTFDGALYPPWGAARFASEAFFDRAHVTGKLDLSLVKFDVPVSLDAIEGTELRMHGSVFSVGQDADLRVGRVDLSRSSFAGGGTIEASGSRLVLDEVQADAPLVITSRREAEQVPHVASVRRARADQIVLGEVDLTRCRFFGAHQLERLRIEPGARFATIGRPLLLTRRAVIAEELDWRRVNQPRRWEAVARTIDPEGAPSQPPSAVASVYRALRRAREDAGDAPGAADFYYGEMEMRRVGGRHPRVSG